MQDRHLGMEMIPIRFNISLHRPKAQHMLIQVTVGIWTQEMILPLLDRSTVREACFNKVKNVLPLLFGQVDLGQAWV